MTALHSCIVCVYKRMLKHGDAWWEAFPKPFDTVPPTLKGAIPVCGRHALEFREKAEAARTPVTMVLGYELYPQGSDA